MVREILCMNSDIFGSSSFGFVLGCVCMCPRVQSILPCVLSEPVNNVHTIAVMGNYCGPRGPDSYSVFPSITYAWAWDGVK